MKKYLSKFASIAEAAAFEGELVAPHVSYVENELAYSGNLELDTPIKISLNAEGKLEISVVAPQVVGPADNEIWYTTTDGNKMVCCDITYDDKDGTAGYVVYILGEPGHETVGNYAIISHEYSEDYKCFVIKCDKPITSTFTVTGSIMNGSGIDSKIQTCHLPNKLNIINGNFLFKCDYLTSITIPNSVTTISRDAFGYCDLLTEIIYNGTKEEWDIIEKQWSWNRGCQPITVHCTDGDITMTYND